MLMRYKMQEFLHFKRPMHEYVVVISTVLFGFLMLVYAVAPPSVKHSNATKFLVTTPDDMQQSPNQVAVTVGEIERVTRRYGTCNLLVFGSGFDSHFWAQQNRAGLTVFLEHDVNWLSTVRAKWPGLAIFHVTYKTQIERDRDKYLDPATWHELGMQLPDIVTQTMWNIIIVDGPDGFSTNSHGRFQTLYASFMLDRSPDALIVVDDCDREVEWKYANLFFGQQSLFLAVPRDSRYVSTHLYWVYGQNIQCFYRMYNTSTGGCL